MAAPRAGPEFRWGQVAALVLFGCVLAFGMNWSLSTNLARVPADSADRLLQAWQVAWNGHALVRNPLDFWDSNTFWPLDNSVAFSDALIGFTPAGFLGSGPIAAVVRYNLLFLFTYVAAFVAAAMLAREIGAGWPAAVVAGAAFAFAPWRLAHHNHLHVLASAGVPLCLFLLLRGYRRRRAGLIVAGFGAAAWQVSLGFTLGIPLAYLLVLLGLLGAGYWQRVRPDVPKRVIVATLAGGLLLTAWSGLQAFPYLKVVDEHPEARRDEATVRFYSPPAASFLIAPPESVVWGGPTTTRRDKVAWAPEMALFPGITVVVLALAGLGFPGLTRRWRLGLALGALGSAVLAMGFSVLDGRFTYGVLYDLAPGWQSTRTPGRLFTFTSLALALLAGAGVHALRERAGGLQGRRWVAAVLTTLVLAAVLVEGLGRPAGGLQAPAVRKLPSSAPLMNLPTDDFSDVQYVFWSIDGFPEIVNGYSGFTPALQQRLRTELESFPDRESVERLERLGVRTVVLHTDRTVGTPWSGAEQRSIQGLGLTRTRDGQMVVFELDRAGEHQERS